MVSLDQRGAGVIALWCHLLHPMLRSLLYGGGVVQLPTSSKFLPAACRCQKKHALYCQAVVQAPQAASSTLTSDGALLQHMF